MENEPGSSPAGDAVRAELADIMSNKENPKHAGYLMQDKKVMEYIDSRYRGAYGAGTVDLSDGLTAGGEAQTTDTASASDASATEVQADLRQEFGTNYDAVMASAQSAVTHLFPGSAGQAALAAVSEQVVAKGPKAEALAVRFLADLDRI